MVCVPEHFKVRSPESRLKTVNFSSTKHIFSQGYICYRSVNLGFFVAIFLALMITGDGIYRITSVDDEYITISANVMITPVIPATHLTSSNIGFC